MLGVEHRLAVARHGKGDAIFDHRDVLAPLDAKRDIDMKIPTLAHMQTAGEPVPRRAASPGSLSAALRSAPAVASDAEAPGPPAPLNDPGLAALLGTGSPAVCMVGKSWDFHVDVALGVERCENIAMIEDSVALAVSRNRETMFDAEHFFDGYKANPSYASIACGRRSGQGHVGSCSAIPTAVPCPARSTYRRQGGGDDSRAAGSASTATTTENAVANSLAALNAGARQVQGTLNGLGERCGNANLVSLIPTLLLKTIS